MAKLVREFGEQLAVSVGTALPIEKRLLVPKPQVKFLWLNSRTLFRNFYGSIDTPEKVSRKDIVGEFMQEVFDLRAILEAQGIVVIT